jgi:hypothetical protein
VFESRRGHGCLSLEIVVCCQVAVSASTDHSSREVLPRMACLECDHKASIMRMPWPTSDVAPLKKFYVINMV